MSKIRQQLISKAEDLTDDALRYSRNLLPHIAHLCLVTTFIEDGLRMIMQWGDHVEYMKQASYVGGLAFVVVLYNVVIQLGCSAMVLLRLRVPLACALLATIVIFQSLIYNTLSTFEMAIVSRTASLLGALLFLYAETWVESKSTFAGVPKLETGRRARSLLQLVGRILLVLLFLLTVQFHGDWVWLGLSMVSAALTFLVVLGYKTRLSAAVLILWLAYLNLTYHPWWRYAISDPVHDFLRYDFFQLLSIIGGLLLLVSLGPGTVSLDEKKKKW